MMLAAPCRLTAPGRGMRLVTERQVLLTVNGPRSIGHRAALVAGSRDGELRQRADEGLELIPIAPRTGNGPVGGVEVFAARQTAAPRRHSRARPTVSRWRRSRSPRSEFRRPRGGADARRSWRRGASIFISGKLVLPLEVSPGRLLHRAASEAIRRMLVGDGVPAGTHRDGARSGSALERARASRGGQRARSVLAASRRARGRQRGGAGAAWGQRYLIDAAQL